ncbi:MAG: hypothetical protein J0M08_01160 [Bacteroidetes bacterium]|nr:hypothetical protein [Bacteroidota bacterium]
MGKLELRKTRKQSNKIDLSNWKPKRKSIVLENQIAVAIITFKGFKNKRNDNIQLSKSDKLKQAEIRRDNRKQLISILKPFKYTEMPFGKDFFKVTAKVSDFLELQQHPIIDEISISKINNAIDLIDEQRKKWRKTKCVFTFKIQLDRTSNKKNIKKSCIIVLSTKTHSYTIARARIQKHCENDINYKDYNRKIIGYVIEDLDTFTKCFEQKGVVALWQDFYSPISKLNQKENQYLGSPLTLTKTK